ncbi:ATP-binding protein [Polyangium aurulentum]|uniref:ATP-binding protein n=1 Tax=Polyangium aurulentum TaxID=2567896 RepID=UPI0010ADEACC|nr:ATP-binding protein [Polyangium aurulentum]UQA57433.1 ATP-binding protein [Polyangium aurulentum]
MLLALALGEAPAERLTDQERAAIAVETPVTSALRWATAVESVRHLALVGPPGTGKTFAAQLASRYGVVGIELPSAEAVTAGEVARDIVAALRENRRLLLTARADDLSTWAARDDLDGALAAILQETREAAGARDEWPPPASCSIAVLDLAYVVTARTEVIDDLLRRAASLAQGAPRDTAREAASVALRDLNVRAWARACVLDAERRMGPLTISELWRFVATLACGARPIRGRCRFDVADSVAARLLRHEFAPEALRALAKKQEAIREDALAAHAGFDGVEEDVYCSDPQALAGQSAVFLLAPPALDRPQDDYRALINRLAPGVVVSAHAVFSPMFADSLTRVLTLGARRPSLHEGVGEHVEFFSSSSTYVSAVVPNPFMCRALGNAWVAALHVRCGGQSFVLGARAYDAVRALAAQGKENGLALHADGAARRNRGLTASDQARAVSADLQAEVAQGTSRDRDSNARRAPIASADLAFAARPLGLLFALSARGALDDAVCDGGAVRVASPADLGATTPTLTSRPEFTERWQPRDRIALGTSLREFIEARIEIVGAFAAAGSTGSRALDASLSLDVMSIGACSSVAVERYLSAYAALMDAAVTAGGEVLDRALMLDVAYCPVDALRRARLLPLHPLMVSRWAPPDDEGSGRLPPVLAVSQQRTFALYAEGEPGFYHGEPEQWPTIAEQRGAVRDATGAWLRHAGEIARLDVDLIDARFATSLVEEVASCVARRALERRAMPAIVKVRLFASSFPRAASLAPITLDKVDGVPIVCDPSVRSVSEARGDAFVFAVIPAPHGGRRPRVASNRLPGALASYGRALAAVYIDSRPHELEHSPEPSVRCSAFISWTASPLEDGGSRGHWRLSLRDHLAPTSLPTSASASAASTPSSAPGVAVGAEPSATTAEASTPFSEDRRTEGGCGTPLANLVVTTETRRWTREALRAQVARTLGRVAYVSDEALIADLVRDTVAARRGPLRHAVVGDIVECVGSLLERDNPREVVARTVDALVDLGDLVARRSSERGPYVLELASAALVELRGSERTILLGRAESALSDGARAAVAVAGMLRVLDLGRAREARDELRFRGVVEIAWEEWARVPRFGSPDESLGAESDMKRFDGKFDEYDAFDPSTPPNFYRGRFLRGALEAVLERDRWAVASRDAGFDAREYRLFRRADGVVTSAAVDHARFVELAAACAARAAGGRQFMATEERGALRLHFPPPRWLARLLALGQAVDPGRALVAWLVPDDLLADVRSALRRGLWCEVAPN